MDRNKKYICFTAILVLIFIALGGTAYAASLQQRRARLNVYKDWYKNYDKVIIPLRIDRVKELGQNRREREQQIKQKYGGWYKRKKRVNGKTVYVYFVARDKSWYRNYFYNKRWSHLSKSKQDKLWKKRMDESTYIKMKIQRWCNKEEREIQNLIPWPESTREPLTASYADLQGSYYMDNFKWLITVDLEGESQTAMVKFYFRSNTHKRGYSYGGSCDAFFEKKQSFWDNGKWVKKDVLYGNMQWVKWKKGTPQPPHSFIRLWIKSYSATQPRIPYMEFRIMRPPWVPNSKMGPKDGTGDATITTWRGKWNRRAQDLTDRSNVWWPKSGF